MADIELRYPDGTVEQRELSRRQPLSIGSQAFNDVAVDDLDVAALHCRIGWNKTAYEVTAASKDGVDVNGQLVQHALLKPGDVVRVGRVDLVFQGSPAEDEKPKARDAKDADRKERGKGKKPLVADRSDDKKGNGPADDLSVFEGPVIAESVAEMLNDADAIPSAAEMIPSSADLEATGGDQDALSEHMLLRGGKGEAAGSSLPGQIKSALAANRVRPGDQEILKSPLVLSLTGGGTVLLLVTATIWFLMGRDVSQRLFDRAKVELAEGRYAQAIATYEEFLQKYPAHALSPQARIGAGQAKIQKELSGATPSWKRGLEELDAFLARHRDEPDFKSLQPAICDYAQQIALGAVKTAEAAKDESLLTTAADATRLLENFSDPQQPPTVTLEQIRVGMEQAKTAIRKQRTIDAALTVMDEALKNRQPIEALRERARLLQIYPDVQQQKRVRDVLQQAMALEKSVIAVSDLDQAAATADETIPETSFVAPIFHTRSRTDESASGRYAYAVAKDSIYAVDVVTGETAWRRVIGPQTPFFPLLTAGAQPGLLLGETAPAALALRHAETGKQIWRQPLGSGVRGAPLIHHGEIFVACGDRKLLRFDLDTGLIKQEMTFSQDLVGPPTAAPGDEQLLIAGETALLYAVSIRPLEIAAITFSNHPRGAVAVPLLTMGRLVLMCDNDQLESSRLRVWDAGNPRESLTEVGSVRIGGQVVDRPVLRGPQLVVPSTGERLHAYTVSDDPETKGLASIGEYRIQDGYQGPMQLALGSDQQFWMASSTFRRFQVSNDSLRLDQNAAAPGIASQPLQQIGEQFFVGRRPPYADAVIFTQMDRERLTGSWRTILGAGALAWTDSRSGGLILISEVGTVISVSPQRLQQGGLELRSSVELPLPEQMTEPLRATRLSDGRLAAWAAGSSAKLWLINPTGQTETEIKLDAPLDAAPVLLKDGIVLPLAGRLKWHGLTRGGPRIQDYAAPVADGEPVRWAHLVGIDDREIVACDRNGQLSRIQIRQDDVVHLAEAAKFSLPQKVTLPLVLSQDDLWLADDAGTVRRLDSRSFDVKAERQFPEPVSGLWIDGDEAWVQSVGGRLYGVTTTEELPDRWMTELGTTQLVGTPLRRGGNLLVVGRDGAIVLLEAESGKELERRLLPQELAYGPLIAGDTLLAIARDGTIYRVDPPAGGQP